MEAVDWRQSKTWQKKTELLKLVVGVGCGRSDPRGCSTANQEQGGRYSLLCGPVAPSILNRSITALSWKSERVRNAPSPTDLSWKRNRSPCLFMEMEGQGISLPQREGALC